MSKKHAQYFRSMLVWGTNLEHLQDKISCISGASDVNYDQHKSDVMCRRKGHIGSTRSGLSCSVTTGLYDSSSALLVRSVACNLSYSVSYSLNYFQQIIKSDINHIRFRFTSNSDPHHITWSKLHLFWSIWTWLHKFRLHYRFVSTNGQATSKYSSSWVACSRYRRKNFVKGTDNYSHIKARCRSLLMKLSKSQGWRSFRLSRCKISSLLNNQLRLGHQNGRTQK